MKYVYGIVPSHQVHAARLELAGLYGQPLQVISCNGVSAIVSEAVSFDYSGLSKPQLVKLLAQHQQTTEQIMGRTPTLLPVKFGSVLAEGDVLKLLAQARCDLEQALEHVDEQIELELLVIWEPQRVFAQLANHPKIAELRALAQTCPPEEMQRIQIAAGALVKQMLDAQRALYAERTRTALADLASDVEVNAVVNDQVVANLAFLLPRSRQAEFEQRVETLDKALGGELLFKVVGPLPPYSFSTVEIDQILPEDVTWACDQLEVGPAASGEEIRAAYWRQARLHHPDSNPQDADAAALLFKDDNTAYRLLRHCYAVQHRGAVQHEVTPQSSVGSFRCNLAEAAAGGLLRVTISRSSDLAARN